jgi:hypothetical protein
MLYLPRLTVLVTSVADRPGAWFPGPLSPYQAWIFGICLCRDFKRAKVPETPTKSTFCFGVFLGVNFFKKNRESRQPNHVKDLLSCLNKLFKGNFCSLRSAPGDPRAAHCSHFSVQFCPRFLFFPRFLLTRILARRRMNRHPILLANAEICR